ncbi:MAG: hypothetical protein AAB368_02090 [bacterium]
MSIIDTLVIVDTSTINVLVVDNLTNVITVDNPKTLVSIENTTVELISAGTQGPAGPPGTSEEDVVYSKRTDFITDNEIYKGEAAVGSLTTNAVWRIRKLVISDIDNDITETWAGGTANFDKVWGDRVTYTYT